MQLAHDPRLPVHHGRVDGGVVLHPRLPRLGRGGAGRRRRRVPALQRAAHGDLLALHYLVVPVWSPLGETKISLLFD